MPVQTITPIRQNRVIDTVNGEKSSTDLTPGVSKLTPLDDLSSPSPQSSTAAVEEDDDFDAMLEADPNYDLQAQAHPNQPPKSGIWSFINGQDTESARLNQPNHGKFVFYRVQTDKEDVTDVRQYSRWADFDWSDSLSIERLNKWRTQIRNRTIGPVQEAALPWTLAEKNAVKKAVEDLIKDHKSKSSLFPAVTEAVTAHFDKVTQPKGSALVSSSSSKAGVVVMKRKNVGVTSADRTGFRRSWKTVYNKVMDFHDIRALLKNLGEEDEEAEGGAASSTKKRKRAGSKAGKDKASLASPKKAKTSETSGEAVGGENMVEASGLDEENSGDTTD